MNTTNVITPTMLKEFLGPERVALLEKMPVIKEGKGLEAHLQEACKDAPFLTVAMARCLRSAGSVATMEDIQRATAMEFTAQGNEVSETAEDTEVSGRKKTQKAQK